MKISPADTADTGVTTSAAKRIEPDKRPLQAENNHPRPITFDNEARHLFGPLLFVHHSIQYGRTGVFPLATMEALRI